TDSVSRISCRSSGRGRPTTKETQESATQPSTSTAKSREIRSPASSTRSCGLPCNMPSLTEVQITYPKRSEERRVGEEAGVPAGRTHEQKQRDHTETER